MDGSGSGLCAVVGFGISGVEPLCSVTRRLVPAVVCVAGWRVLCVELTVCLHLILGPHTHTHTNTHTHTHTHTRGGRGLDVRHYVA